VIREALGGPTSATNLKNKINATAVHKMPRPKTEPIASMEGVSLGQLIMANGK
jgi:hypothetical protein